MDEINNNNNNNNNNNVGTLWTKVVLLNILVFIFLGSKQEDKKPWTECYPALI
jgi:hypothetical protein